MKVMQRQQANIESQQQIEHRHEMTLTRKIATLASTLRELATRQASTRDDNHRKTCSASQQTRRASNTSSISKRWQSQERHAALARKQGELATRQASTRDGNHRNEKQRQLAKTKRASNRLNIDTRSHAQKKTNSASQHTKRASNTSSIDKRWQSQERHAALARKQREQASD